MRLFPLVRLALVVCALACPLATAAQPAPGRATGAALAQSFGAGHLANGVAALYSNTSGAYNTANGHGGPQRQHLGRLEHTASGYHALFANTTGHHNTATGVNALSGNTTGFYNTASGANALFLNSGTNNVATGAEALFSNGGNDNTATGTSALYHNTSASFNVAHGTAALYNTTTGGSNTAVGDRAGLNATTGSYNVYLGAGVWGIPTDTNTMRLGLPYDSGTGAGQNRTFIAGIHGTELTGPAAAVYVDANGQLGTLPPYVVTPGGTTSAPLAVEQQIQSQQETTAELRVRVARLEALVQALVRGR
jgi:hypothetical protein